MGREGARPRIPLHPARTRRCHGLPRVPAPVQPLRCLRPRRGGWRGGAGEPRLLARPSGHCGPCDLVRRVVQPHPPAGRRTQRRTGVGQQ
ncbi:hypothetical protein D187_007979 [Cystobacter fuscus DSM 2262]|uniref:Uncharacterized protein n=1 Tax=Cystobacter fuscus (strain ATCC 25194 / DSM 2262 / NBRC 100088 / M29) TaxID=1242864 RepID=S9P332_CYSF2|nr:hypothetical protein D187_007979 [Cystobacter fuscus DSM 2262]